MGSICGGCVFCWKPVYIWGNTAGLIGVPTELDTSGQGRGLTDSVSLGWLCPGAGEQHLL